MNADDESAVVASPPMVVTSGVVGVGAGFATVRELGWAGWRELGPMRLEFLGLRLLES
jgi:hypothetical protein